MRRHVSADYRQARAARDGSAKKKRTDWAAVFDLIASEYGWTIEQFLELTMRQLWVFLDKINQLFASKPQDELITLPKCEAKIINETPVVSLNDNREIDLTPFLPSYLHETEFAELVTFFQDFLNTLHDEKIHTLSHEIAHLFGVPNDKLYANAYGYLIRRELGQSDSFDGISSTDSAPSIS